MILHKKFFPEVLGDNETAYFLHLLGVIESVDEDCSLEITKHPNSYNFRLAPSLPKYNELIIKELLKLHNLFSIKLDMSKSIKTSGAINFQIYLEN
jgi:hypothetical protein